MTPLSNAVARICLADVQDRLPKWTAVDAKGNTLLGRREFGHQERLLPLQPQSLLCINWADSGPGLSWTEEYHATYLPGFHRYVVTASADSTNANGVTDWAVGWFLGKADVSRSSNRLISKWWRRLYDEYDQAPWQYVFSAGLIHVQESEAIRRRVWRGCDGP